MIRGLYAVWLVVTLNLIAATGFGQDSAPPTEPDPNSLAYLKAHAEDLPPSVILKEALAFKVYINNKEAGSMELPAGTVVDIVSVASDQLQVRSGPTNVASVAPEKTDLWERVAALRTTRANRPDPARDDPANALALPANSAAADWYRKALKEQIDPWLAKYATHRLASDMTQRKKAFEEELARVDQGEVRRGEQWFTAAQWAEQRTEIESTELIAQLNASAQSKDAVQLTALLSKVDALVAAPQHPKLIRAVHAALSTTIASLPADSADPQIVQQRRDFEEAMRTHSLQLAAAEESVVDKLDKATALSPSEAAPLLAECSKLWPENTRTVRLALEKATAAATQMNTAFAAGDIPQAAQLNDAIQKLSRVVPESAPELAPIKKSTASLTASLAQARELEQAFAATDFDKIADTNFSGAPPALQKWAAALQAKVEAQKKASTAAIEQAQTDLLHFQFGAAQASFQKAKDLWPSNPDVAQREQWLTWAAFGGGLVGLFVLLGLWGWFSSFAADLRYKRAMKKQAEKQNRRPL